MNEILLKNLMSVPTVAKAGEKVVIKIPFEGRLPVRAMWLKDKIELGDDSRIRVDKTDTFTMLSISNAERKDCGDYKVRLKNDSGILDIDLKVEVIGKIPITSTMASIIRLREQNQYFWSQPCLRLPAIPG